jgi:uncharacterized protein
VVWWWIGGLIAFLIVLDLSLRLPFIRMAAGFFEEIPAFSVVPAEPVAVAERIAFPTTDGLTLRGSRLRHTGNGPPAGVVVFSPELGGTHWSAAHYAAAALEAGWDVVAFDFRNQGESDALPDHQPMHWLTRYEFDDLHAAVEYTRGRDEYRTARLVLFGVSRGGGTSLAVASRRKDVAGVWVDSGFSTDNMVRHFAKRWAPLVCPTWLLNLLPTWHVNQTLRIVRWYSRFRTGRPYRTLEPLLPRLRGTPVQLVSGKRDTYVPTAIAEDLARRIGPSANVWVVPKAKHNAARGVVPEEYDRRLTTFLGGGRPVASEAVAEPIESPQTV